MITVPDKGISGVNCFEMEVGYGPENGNATETYITIKSDQAMHIHGPDIETSELRITLMGEWERSDLNRVLRGHDWSTVVERELKKCKRREAQLQALQEEAMVADNLEKMF